MRLDETTHQYFSKAGEEFLSVTKFVDRFFPPFEERKVAERCSKKRDDLSPEELRAAWEVKRKAASTFGTNVHRHAQNLLLGKGGVKPCDDKEQQYFDLVGDYVKALLDKRTIIGVEQILSDAEHRLAGCADLIVRDKFGMFGILDWKTNEMLRFSSTSNALHPLEHLEDCNYVRYCLQLNVYAFLLSRCCDIRGPYAMQLLYVTGHSVQTIQVTPMKDEVLAMLSVRKSDLEERHAREATRRARQDAHED